MTVYVDEPDKPFGRMLMCHMIADSRIELLVMCDKIGVDRRWIQHKDTFKEHFDISKGKRALAVKAGAIELSNRDLAEKIYAKVPSKHKA